MRTSDEFELIREFFAELTPRGRGVRVGPGDDAAVVAVPEGHELVVTTDALLAGVHFFAGGDPAGVGHKSLAVNLSDLAAMAAQPCWATLVLSIPEVDRPWLEAFCRGFRQLAVDHGVALVGGDTVRGPLSVTVQALGVVPAGAAVGRGGAQPGDGIYVTGELGGAATALEALTGGGAADPDCLVRLERPVPRLTEGLALRGLASAAIDISDGLAADLGHVLRASGAGAVVRVADIPFCASLRDSGMDRLWRLGIAGGDDYELCFTAPDADAPAVAERVGAGGIPVSRIGEIRVRQGTSWLLPDGSEFEPQPGGYRHF